MRRLFAFALVLTLGTYATADEIKPKAVVSGPSEVFEDQPFLLSAMESVSDDKEKIVWSVFKEKRDDYIPPAFTTFQQDEKKNAACFVQQAGVGEHIFIVTVYVNNTIKTEGKPDIVSRSPDTTIHRITVKRRAPLPVPTPGPDPVTPLPDPANKYEAMGRTYAPVVPTTYADAWEAAAQIVANGGSVKDAQAALQATWLSKRTDAFRIQVAPVMAELLPAGTEPTTPAQRAAVAQMWKDFAKGLKGGR